jgi:hypothetical protein
MTAALRLRRPTRTSVLSYNGWTREASQLIRDVSEAISFTRALDLLGAIHLMQIERRFFKTEESMACRTVELLRRTSRVSCRGHEQRQRHHRAQLPP